MPGYVRLDPVFSAARAPFALPEPIIAMIVGAPIEADGRRLSPAAQLLVTLERRARPLAGDPTDVARRRVAMRLSAGLAMPRVHGVHAVDRHIPGPAGAIRVRIYRAERADRAGAEPSAIVYLHGGGWVVGDLGTHDGACRMLARESGAVVVAVDYRLAPEHPFPAALHDGLAAFRWAVANSAELSIRSGAVAVMGDSAGGNLAAALCILARDDGGPTPIAQGLVYPVTDLTAQAGSRVTFADGFFLTGADMAWYVAHYAPEPATARSPLASPLQAADLTGLPPAFVWTAGFDLLRDEGRAYADRLAEAGVPTRHRCLDDQVHGFLGMGVLPGGPERIAAVCAEMGALIAGVA